MSISDIPPGGAPAAELSVPMMSGPTWQDQDGILRDMWMQNQTPQAIAEALGRSVPAIMTRAARLGLPRRAAPGRKPGRRMMDENGAPISHTQRSTVRASSAIIKDAPPQTSLRVCLMCLTKFESVGRHNRICSGCKSSPEYETASSLPELHIPVS